MREHKSSWSVEELEGFGFNVFRMNGWKKTQRIQRFSKIQTYSIVDYSLKLNSKNNL